MLEWSVTADFIVKAYDKAHYMLVESMDNDFMKGFGFLFLWALIIGIVGLFVYSFFTPKRWVGIGIVAVVIIAEVFSAIGRLIS